MLPTQRPKFPRAGVLSLVLVCPKRSSTSNSPEALFREFHHGVSEGTIGRNRTQNLVCFDFFHDLFNFGMREELPLNQELSNGSNRYYRKFRDYFIHLIVEHV